MHESDRGHETVKNGQEASVHKTHMTFTPSGIHGTWAKYGNRTLHPCEDGKWPLVY